MAEEAPLLPPPTLPPLRTLLESVPPPGELTLNRLGSAIAPRTPITQRTAYLLVVVLHLLSELNEPVQNRQASAAETWATLERRNEERHALERILEEVWGQFIERADAYPEEDEDIVEAVLWYEVAIDIETDKRVRVVDFLINPLTPQWILSHPLVMISLQRTWARGITYRTSERTSWTKRALLWFDSFSTPRVLHAISLITHIVYLWLLALLVLEPPFPPIFMTPFPPPPPPGAREIVILIFAIAESLFLPRFASSVVAISIFTSLPSRPLPGTIQHNFILLAFAIHLIELLYPLPPTPLLLLPPEVALPTSTFFRSTVGRALGPALNLFLPLFLIILVLLSSSVSDDFMILSSFTTSSASSGEPAPTQTRLTFLLLFIAIILLFCLFTQALLASVPAAPSAMPSPWDTYPTTAHEARIIFAATLIRFTGKAWPLPVNLIELVAIRAPVFVLEKLGKREASRKWKDIVGVWSWRLFVGQKGLVTAGLWLWR